MLDQHLIKQSMFAKIKSGSERLTLLTDEYCDSLMEHETKDTLQKTFKVSPWGYKLDDNVAIMEMQREKKKALPWKKGFS